MLQLVVMPPMNISLSFGIQWPRGHQPTSRPMPQPRSFCFSETDFMRSQSRHSRFTVLGFNTCCLVVTAKPRVSSILQKIVWSRSEDNNPPAKEPQIPPPDKTLKDLPCTHALICGWIPSARRVKKRFGFLLFRFLDLTLVT
eukprot:Skav214910  [mRNA]  locus=scaffold3783:64450:66930:+ [translate_table: standard]